MSLVCAIDVGMQNMGFCAWDLDKWAAEKEAYFPYTERSSILVTSDGDKYDWEERYCTEMVLKWVRDRWEEYFMKARLVIVEKQMVQLHIEKWRVMPESAIRAALQRERVAMDVMRSLYDILYVYNCMGLGPPVLVKSPLWWKPRVGLEVGGHVDGLSASQRHTANKKRSKQLFVKLNGSGRMQQLVKRLGPKTDDAVDAYWMGLAAARDLEKLEKELLRTSNHKEEYGQTTARVPQAKRRRVKVDLRHVGASRANDLFLTLEEREHFLKHGGKPL